MLGFDATSCEVLIGVVGNPIRHSIGRCRQRGAQARRPRTRGAD